jgi:2-succinyl-6-hydroxy-2,4-cyclohexadiene-1-carboxylate synthase
VEKIYVIALHGFLGCPSDWDDIISEMDVEWVRPDLFSDSSWGAGKSLKQTYSCIYNKAKKLNEKGRVFILGYSMGGRLALGALSLDTRGVVFSGAILISVNPGLDNKSDKIKRIKADKVWSDKIAQIHNESGWKFFLKDWNSQSVFKSGTNNEPKRKFSDYNMLSLASAMTRWSLGLQPDFRKNLFTLRIPILWIVGEQDIKFVEMASRLAEALKNNKNFQKIIISNSGHRVIFSDY